MRIAGHPAIAKLVKSMTTVSAESVAKITFGECYLNSMEPFFNLISEANIGRLSGRSIPATLNSLIGMRSYATHSDQGGTGMTVLDTLPD